MSDHDYEPRTRWLGEGMEALGMVCMADDKAFMDAIAASWDAPQRVVTTQWEDEDAVEEREMAAREGAGRLPALRERRYRSTCGPNCRTTCGPNGH